ncbi:12504_t:CDS:2 [Entrophospora sp. SA101]|nr:12504_t:CDS:2 [Entrophospora sp. SA101]
MYSENLSQSSNADNNKDSQNLIFSNKRNHISEVWNYFEKIEWGKDKKIAKCIIAKCTHNAFSCGKEGTTRPLWHHLENSHWMVYVKTEEYYKKKKKTQIESGNIEEFLKKSSVSPVNSSTTIDNEKFHDMIAIWLINCQRPFLTAEDPELIEIFRYLNPNVKPVKADAIKNTIMKLYKEGKRELKVYLSTINSKISFTSDLWTSPNNKAFVSATAHYIDDDWVLHETVVDFGLMKGKHEGVKIANGFFDVLKDYDIISKFQAITLDNASNNDTFVRELATKLREETETEELNSAIRTSPQWVELLENACNACKIKVLKPILDCTTRWNSTHDMIRNGLYLKPALNTLTSIHDDLHQYAISHTQWATLEKIVEFLEPFKDLTLKMSTSSYSTAYLIIPLFNIIIDHVEDTADLSEGEVTGKIQIAAKAARDKLVRYYSKTNMFMMLCTALDPRRKLYYFTKKGFLDDDISETKMLMRHLLEIHYTSTSISITNSSSINDSNTNKDTDVLAWWKAHQKQFPHLACIARDYLSIPATSTSSERLFSSSKNMITDKRCKLAPKTVRAGQCLKSWMQGPLKEKLGIYSSK